jgi:hypothetical protein
MPANPRAWLISTSPSKAIDAMRRRARFDASHVEIAERLEAEDSAQALIAGAGPRSGDAVKGDAPLHCSPLVGPPITKRRMVMSPCGGFVALRPLVRRRERPTVAEHGCRPEIIVRATRMIDLGCLICPLRPTVRIHSH